MGGIVKSATSVFQSLLGLEAPTPAPVPVIPAAETPPVVTPVKAMPSPLKDDAQTKSVVRRSVADQRRRRGRQSTILTTADMDDSLG